MHQVSIFAAMKSHFYQPGYRLGILGGGQLGRMFIQEATNLNVSVCILDPDPNAPCAKLAHEFQNGSFKDFDTVYAFGKSVDLLTVEIEHVNVDALEKLEAEGLPVYPSPAVLRVVQDKGRQKQFYQEKGIPTAPFFLVENKEEIANYRNEFPFMQKLRTGGYDGRGVTRLADPDQLDHAFEAPSVLEQFVDFEKELAVIVARNPSGEIKTFPVVELEFNPEANLVEFLFSPADINAQVAEDASKIAHQLATELNLVGVLAVELFLTKDGQVLVNEIAPRPHNSGHQTIEGNYTSQYAQHMRAILDLPLGNTDLVQAAVMVNVLGEKGHTGDAVFEGLEEVLSWPGVFVHLYGKKTTKPMRKMGHVTLTGPDLDSAKALARKVQATLKVLT